MKRPLVTALLIITFASASLASAQLWEYMSFGYYGSESEPKLVFIETRFGPSYWTSWPDLWGVFGLLYVKGSAKERLREFDAEISPAMRTIMIMGLAGFDLVWVEELEDAGEPVTKYIFKRPLNL